MLKIYMSELLEILNTILKIVIGIILIISAIPSIIVGTIVQLQKIGYTYGTTVPDKLIEFLNSKIDTKTEVK